MGHPDWLVFSVAAAVTLFTGVSMMLTTRSSRLGSFTLRQAFVMTNLAWLVIAAFGALPFTFSELELDVSPTPFSSPCPGSPQPAPR